MLRTKLQNVVVTLMRPLHKKEKTMDILNNIRTWNRVRQTRNELNSLSTRELNDLGISRGDIPFIAKRALRR